MPTPLQVFFTCNSPGSRVLAYKQELVANIDFTPKPGTDAGGKSIWLARQAPAPASAVLTILDFSNFPRHAQETSEVLVLKKYLICK